MSLTVTSSIFYFLIMICVVLLAHVIARRSSFYDALTTPKHATFEPEAEINAKLKNRHEMLDGLRGFLALGVLFQHAVTNFAYFYTGVWQITPIRFYRHAGGEAVILFFMITSFLYWSKAIASKGNVDTKKLYRNRFLRLAPMYIFSACLVTLSVLVQTGFNITSGVEFIKDMLSWLTLGLVTTTTVNGLSVIPINAGIHWTLHYEWIFYLLLPVTAIVLRGGMFRLFAVPMIAVVLLMSDWGYWIIFLFGIVAAHIVHKWPRVNWIKESWWVSLVPILGLITVYLIQYKPYGVSQYAISLIVLLCFIYGNSLFGLLNTKAARFLGTISYSVYLMHGIVLFTVLNLANAITPVANLTVWCFWGLILITALLTVLTSTITYRYIEHPFLQKKVVKE